MDDFERSEEEGREGAEPPTPSRPSTIPSWVMLGFIAGGLFVWLLQVTVEEAPPPPAPPVEAPIVRVPTRPQLMEVEAVFAQYAEYARWENNVTEIALWNRGAQAIVDRFEVRRVGETFYFRTIPQFTRRVLAHGVPDNLPIQFTETEAQYQQWLRDVAQENARQVSRGIMEAFGGRRDAAGQSSAPAPASPPEAK